jgi:biotin operon repressor
MDHKFPSEEAVYKLLYLGHGRQPVSWVGEARREVGGAAASRSEHLAAQGVLGGEGDAREDASGAVCPPYTNAYTYILTRPVKLIPNGAFHPSCSLFAGRGRTLQELSMQLGWTRQRVRYHLQRLLAQGVVEETAPGVYQSRINLTLEDAKIVRRLCDSICRSLDPPPEGTLFLQLEPLSLDVVQSRLEWILRAVKSQLSGEELTSSSKYRIFLILVPTTKE